VAIPEFVLRKLFVQGSLQAHADGFSFALRNTFAPGTITGLGLEVDGKAVPAAGLTLQAGNEAARPAAAISPENPFPLPVGLTVHVRVLGVSIGQGQLKVRAETREAGPLVFGIQAKEKASRPQKRFRLRLPRFMQRPLKAEVDVDGEAVIGEIHPHVYGHFVEHLERCVYGGIWTEDGDHVREDTLGLVRALQPPVIRYPGGNFASGYHWEDGVGPRDLRPRRYDKAWNSWESNAVGTDEFMAFCAAVPADPFLVVNDGSGTPEEAARWVAYCNDAPTTGMGPLRASNGHADPYGVQLWGIGNEVWGQWQIGHTDASEYARRLRHFAVAMRQADPSIHIVAVGDGPHTDQPDDPARLWNEAVLREAGALIDYLSFHIYQPNQEGWKESYDADALHHTVCAAPLDVEAIVGRMARQIEALAPGGRIGVALDEWNLWLAPPPGAATMHRLIYTLRDALYVAGMLNVFHRCCRTLTLANLAQLVNVLPAIVTDEQRAYATPIYYPFLMYRQMEKLAVHAQVQVRAFNSEALGNIQAHRSVPYLDVTATRDEPGQRLVLGVVNRHPTLPVEATVHWRGLGPLRTARAWILSSTDPLAANSFDAPNQVVTREVLLPEGEVEVGMSLCLGAAGELTVRETPPSAASKRCDRQVYRFPAASVTVIELRSA
jgi:alpha-N-arabinofuranosidase